jgi:hypothetical protein
MRIRDYAIALACAAFSLTLLAEDNVLTDQEKKDGWVLLFDGKTTKGWMTPKGKPIPDSNVQSGSLNPHPVDYMLTTEQPHEDFELSLDFKISPKCNSGVFIKTFPLTPRPGKDVGFNGIEIAVDDTKEAGFHDTGAIYDLVKPKKNAMKPVGEWNTMLVRCEGPKIDVTVNGELVTSMNLDEWPTKNKRADGTDHKFDVAYKDHPRKGHIGLQDHGGDCWYKNVKLRTISK